MSGRIIKLVNSTEEDPIDSRNIFYIPDDPYISDSNVKDLIKNCMFCSGPSDFKSYPISFSGNDFDAIMFSQSNNFGGEYINSSQINKRIIPTMLVNYSYSRMKLYDFILDCLQEEQVAYLLNLWSKYGEDKIYKNEFIFIKRTYKRFFKNKTIKEIIV